MHMQRLGTMADLSENDYHDLAYDIKQSSLIVLKIKESLVYRVKLYFALCNTDWQKQITEMILMNDIWSCSWRYSAAMIAEIHGNSDYIDYYVNGSDHLQKEGVFGCYEGMVDSEIKTDLKSIGWVQVNDYDDGF